MDRHFPIEQADLCVKCGLCAPHCPTYALSGMEPESPRGRIAIMSAIASGTIEATDTARKHLDHCLSCQACEAVCPAKVPYLSLLDAHRTDHPSRPSGPERALAFAVSARLSRPALRLGLRLAVTIQPLLRALSTALRWSSAREWLNRLPRQRSGRLPRTHGRADVYIFAGCMGDLANAPAAKALLHCCTALGLQAHVLPAGLCCGALAQHRGQARAAAQQRQTLWATVDTSKPLVLLDSACASQLRDSGWSQVEEACHFLNRQNWPQQHLTSDPQRVLIHQPCSHRNGLRENDAARTLLARVAGLELHDIADPLCCGAAGTHMLQFPQRAARLRQSKLDSCQALQPETLVTTNIGCALHLAAGLHDSAPLTTVCHPVELIARCLEPV